MNIELRKYPYPYQAMLAICSDLDETPNKEIYFETGRYLNTTEQTLFGKGVGLEVGNTIYFDMPEGQFSYTNTDDDGRNRVHQLIESGHIDCLHSFGDFVSSRHHIEQCWESIRQCKRKIEVWIDHGQAPTNLDNDIMKGVGAIVDAEAYHTDLTVQSGAIPFIWKGRVTSIAAQNSRRSYKGILSVFNPVKSLKTLTLEFLKGIFARLGNDKYAMHKDNNLMRQTQLLDGTPVYEFMRTNPSWAGVSVFDSTRGIHNVLNQRMLSTLITNKGCSVFYTHLGKIHSTSSPFTDDTRKAFELLSDYCHEGVILTATTRRLLGYCRTHQELEFEIKQHGDETHIHLFTAYSGEDLNGLTWYVESPEKVHLFVNKKHYPYLQINEPDETNKPSISIAWSALVFPKFSCTL